MRTMTGSQTVRLGDVLANCVDPQGLTRTVQITAGGLVYDTVHVAFQLDYVTSPTQQLLMRMVSPDAKSWTSTAMLHITPLILYIQSGRQLWTKSK